MFYQDDIADEATARRIRTPKEFWDIGLEDKPKKGNTSFS